VRWFPGICRASIEGREDLAPPHEDPPAAS
jgi:hypothetical protein